jgi:hypothetical protein
MTRPVPRKPSYLFNLTVSETRLAAVKRAVQAHQHSAKGETFNQILGELDEVLAGRRERIEPLGERAQDMPGAVRLTCTISGTRHSVLKRYIDEHPESNKSLVFTALMFELNAMLLGSRPRLAGVSQERAAASNEPLIHKSQLGERTDGVTLHAETTRPNSGLLRRAKSLDLAAMHAARKG